MKSIMIATLLVGLIGLFIGIVLGIASEKFKVVVDEKEQKIDLFFQVITVVPVVIQGVMV